MENWRAVKKKQPGRRSELFEYLSGTKSTPTKNGCHRSIATIRGHLLRHRKKHRSGVIWFQRPSLTEGHRCIGHSHSIGTDCSHAVTAYPVGLHFPPDGRTP
jgi:hypothetical protein